MRWRNSYVWWILAAFASVASAQRLAKFEELRRAMEGYVLDASKIDPKSVLSDCSNTDVKVLEGMPASGTTQWIYNTAYSWQVIDFGGKTCVFLDMPEHRGLTPDEARMLLSASQRQWPVNNPPERPLQPDEMPGFRRPAPGPDPMRRDDRARSDENIWGRNLLP